MQHGFNWYSYFIPAVESEQMLAICGSLTVAFALVAFALAVSSKLAKRREQLVPDSKITLLNIAEVYYEFIEDMVENVIGHHGKGYIPLIGTIFLFIFTSNMVGVVPGLYAPTTNYNMVLALSLFVFVIYNAFGLIENGLGYLKHFMGPMLFLAPAFFAVEIISHLARPLSLTIRLRTNMFADHQVLSVFSNLAPLGVPVAFYGMGVFVSLVQAYVFTLLTTIYIGLAVSHDH